MSETLEEERLHRIACSARDIYFNEEQAGKLPNLALIIRDALLEYGRAPAEQAQGMVPSEPTEEMILKAWLLQSPGSVDSPAPAFASAMRKVYHAMLSAAPSAPPQDANAKRPEDIAKLEGVIKNYEYLIEHTFGTGGASGSYEEFALKELACWALVDEVEALRRGIGFTHVGDDPITLLRNDWHGLLDRDQLMRDLKMVRQSRERDAAMREKSEEGHE